MRRLLIATWAILFAPFAGAIDTPSTLLITGNIRAGNGVTPATGNTVIIFNPATEQVEEKSKLLSNQGLFAVTMTRTSAFNGTALTLQFQKDGRRYQLYESGVPADGGVPANFPFSGGLVPRRASVTGYVGEEVGLAIGEPPPTTDGGVDPGTDTGGGIGTGGGSGAPAEPEVAGSPFDVNDDGTVDQLDVELVKDVVAGRPVASDVELRADVNNDEIVNTRDIIGVIKAANRAERERQRTRVGTIVPRL